MIADITSPKDERLLLIAVASFYRSISPLLDAIFSLPARSIRFNAPFNSVLPSAFRPDILS
jgi:hypothetical protein